MDGGVGGWEAGCGVSRREMKREKGAEIVVDM